MTVSASSVVRGAPAPLGSWLRPAGLRAFAVAYGLRPADPLTPKALTRKRTLIIYPIPEDPIILRT